MYTNQRYIYIYIYNIYKPVSPCRRNAMFVYHHFPTDCSLAALELTHVWSWPFESILHWVRWVRDLFLMVKFPKNPMSCWSLVNFQGGMIPINIPIFHGKSRCKVRWNITISGWWNPSASLASASHSSAAPGHHGHQPPRHPGSRVTAAGAIGSILGFPEEG